MAPIMPQRTKNASDYILLHGYIIAVRTDIYPAFSRACMIRDEEVQFRVLPIVLSLAFSTMFNSTTFSSSRRKLQRANPSGAGEQVRAINFASAAPSKIRGRAEFGLYLRVSAAAIPSSTSRRRVR